MSVTSASVDDIVDDNDAEGDSKPLDFSTYVPTYNPNLESSSELPQSLGTPNVTEISQDEAFSRAMNAMYWTGYWSAIYHVRNISVLRGKTDMLLSPVGKIIEKRISRTNKLRKSRMKEKRICPLKSISRYTLQRRFRIKELSRHLI